MDSASTAPDDDFGAIGGPGDGSSSSDGRRVVIHPSSLATTSSLLALVVSLLQEGASDGGADPQMVVRAKYMYDMTRVLLTELPADAALDRL